MSDQTPTAENDAPDLRALLANVRVRFWACPVKEHARRGEPVVTVEWTDGVAHCTYPGCDQTSVTPPGVDQ